MAKLAAAGLVAFVALMATTLENLSLSDLVDQSTMVVRGKVSIGVGEVHDGVILTHYQLSTADVWKGKKSSQVDIYVPGGATGGIRQSVPGAPELVPGVEYVVFLWVGNSGRPQIMGLSQGLFTVSKDVTTGVVYVDRGRVSEMMIDPKTGHPMTDQAVHLKAADLQAFVQKRVVQNQPAGAISSK
jgi:hypothetical protein